MHRMGTLASIYIKAETSCENAWGPATWHSNVAFNIFLPIFIKFFFYCYPIDHSNLFLLLYKFSIFYLFLLSFFYCYPIDHISLFLPLYWYELFLTIRPKVIHYKMDYLLKVDQILWKTQVKFLPYILWPKFDHSHM